MKGRLDGEVYTGRTGHNSPKVQGPWLLGVLLGLVGSLKVQQKQEGNTCPSLQKEPGALFTFVFIHGAACINLLSLNSVGHGERKRNDLFIID